MQCGTLLFVLYNKIHLPIIVYWLVGGAHFTIDTQYTHSHTDGVSGYQIKLGT